MKRLITISALLLGCAAVSVAQTPAHPSGTDGATLAGSSTTKPGAVIKLPADRGAQLKQIQERQDVLAKEFQELEASKVIVRLRSCLELNLNAEQCDSKDLAVVDSVYVFRPKEQAQAKSAEKKQ